MRWGAAPPRGSVASPGASVCCPEEAIGRTLLVVKVRGPSMLPTMNLTGDVIAVDRVTTRWGTVAVGDVVLLRSPENPRKTISKRVLGLEGDALTYLVDAHKGNASKTVVVPKGHVWVQGDNIYLIPGIRDSSGQCLYRLIQGRAFYRATSL